jgi:hypothetical protein
MEKRKWRKVTMSLGINTIRVLKSNQLKSGMPMSRQIDIAVCKKGKGGDLLWE